MYLTRRHAEEELQIHQKWWIHHEKAAYPNVTMIRRTFGELQWGDRFAGSDNDLIGELPKKEPLGHYPLAGEWSRMLRGVASKYLVNFYGPAETE